MRHVIAWPAIVLLVCVAGADGRAADPPKAEAESSPSAAAAKPAEELKLPPGWHKKKRGKFILYCKREAPLGTRLKAETCYDDDGMRNYILALEEEKRDVDKMRATCANLCACGRPDAC